VRALTCTPAVTYEIEECYVRSSDNTCIAKRKTDPSTYACEDVSGVCMGYVRNEICGWLGGECQKIPGNPLIVRIPCGSDTTCDGAGGVCGPVTCPIDEFCADGVCAACGSGGGDGCTKSEPGKPILTLPSNRSKFISPPTTSIQFKWNFSDWNDCCTTTECKNNRDFDLWIYKNCLESENGINKIADSSLYKRDLGWTVRSKWVYNFPSTPRNYCWKVGVTSGRLGGGDRENSSSYRFFTINSTPTPSFGAWWQGKDTDIIASGDIRSILPVANNLILPGSGGYPGVAIYGGVLSLGTNGGKVSSPQNWKAQTATSLHNYTFASFTRKIPTTVTYINLIPAANLDNMISAAGSSGYTWFKYDAALNFNQDLTLTGSGLSVGDKKIVIMVDGGNVNVNTKINLTKGTGFFGVFTNKDINIYNVVGGSGTYDLEGIYFADGSVNTANDKLPLEPTSSLKFRGSVVGMVKVNLQRDLGAANATTPAEFFEYAPDQLFLLPSAFSHKKTQWQEVAP